METNIIITGLEEYQQKLKEIEQCAWTLNILQDELRKIINKMEPRAEIKQAPGESES